MPTSPRDLMGGNASYKRTALFSNLRADEGHRPLREGKDFAIQPGPAQGFRFFPSSVPGCARSTLSVGEGDLRRGLLDFGSAKF